MENRKNIGVEVGSIFVVSLGVFALVSLGTYQAADPSLFSSGAEIPLNACGRAGAFISSVLFHVFGLGAFLFPFSFFVIASALYRGDEMAQVASLLGSVTAAVTSLTVFASLQRSFWSFGNGVLLTGGVLGEWVAVGMKSQLNYFGSSLVSLLVFSISLVIATPVRLTHLVVQGTRILCLLALRGLLWTLKRLGSLVRSGLVSLTRALAQAIYRGVEKMVKPASPEKPAQQTLLTDLPPSQPENLAEKNASVSSTPSLAPIALEQVGNDVPSGASSSSVSSEKGLVMKPSVEDESELEDESVGESLNGIQILPREVTGPIVEKPKASRSIFSSKLGAWKLPVVDFLKKPPVVESQVDKTKLLANSQILKQKFADFGIDGEVTAVRPGPVITLYEFKPGPGVKVSRIASLADDLSMALSAQSVRILAPLPGKSVVGIEIPSEARETVYLREFVQHPDFYGPKHSIPVVMGKDIGGQTVLSDLARMPHLLCAGQTGSGKSVFMNGLICSLLFRFNPDELRMILVDPKFIEFRAYQELPHLLLPVVDDPKQASNALKWAVREMERRYRILAKVGARNLASFNQKVDEMGASVVQDLLFAEDAAHESPAGTSGSDWVEAFDPDETGAPKIGKLPYIVVIIDELADLMMVAKKEVEISIARIAQKARAAGIHLIIATQRPSTDVITGLIKANLPSRVSFQLASYVDSKTILDRAGAERLLGQGDMLFIPPGVSQSLRLHGAYLDDEEISKITSFLKAQGKPSYRAEILLAEEEDEASEDGSTEELEDELFRQAVDLVKHSGHASASFLQRHLKVGYNRAARMIETMESRGIVGPQEGARPREVLIR